MARITVEDCLTKLNNRFALIHLAAKRVRQLRRGAEPLVVCKNKDIVVALREIAAGRVFDVKDTDVKPALEAAEEEASLKELPEETTEPSSPEENPDQEPDPEGK